MMLLKPSPVSTQIVKWSQKDHVFVGEMSEIPGRTFGRVWDDSCDEGLTLVSHSTGVEIVFVIEREVIDRAENEVQGWELRPARGQGLSKDQMKFRMVIFND